MVVLFVFTYFVAISAATQFFLVLFKKPYRLKPYSLILCESSISAFRETISEYHVFSLQMPFGKLGAFFLTFRDPTFSPREHLGKQFWQLGTTMGTHFGISGAHWEAIFAPRDKLGGPWGQQGGRGVARHRILVDLVVISGPVYVSSRVPNA